MRSSPFVRWYGACQVTQMEAMRIQRNLLLHKGDSWSYTFTNAWLTKGTKMDPEKMLEEVYKSALADKDHRIALEIAVLVRNEEHAAQSKVS